MIPDSPPSYRFYDDLAAWWPLISPPEEYAEEAAFVATLLGAASIPVHEVVELGRGGGQNASHLEASFAMTLVDRDAGCVSTTEPRVRASPHLRNPATTVATTAPRAGGSAAWSRLGIPTPRTAGP